MNLKQLVSNTELYLFDMDGTLYLGNQLFPFTKELLKTIRKKGANYLFMTNNSSKSVDDYVKKLEKLGIAATREDIITSTHATAWYLDKYHRGQTLYVCGTQSLKDELTSRGFTVSDDVTKTQCIVMGFDTELTFQKLHDVSYLLLTRPDVHYLATHPDLTCPTEFGSVPDCGSVCAMIYNATGVMPKVFGKPSPLMPRFAMERLGVTPEKTCVVGDRISTDIKSGLNAGITSVLVLSGETDEEILAKSDNKPHLVLQDAGQILTALQSE